MRSCDDARRVHPRATMIRLTLRDALRASKERVA